MENAVSGILPLFLNDRFSRPLVFEDFREGQIYILPPTVITKKGIDHFIKATGDANSLHVDAYFARSVGFENNIAHGLLVIGSIHGIAHKMNLWDRTLTAMTNLDGVKFKTPVYPGATLQYALEVTKTETREDKLDTGAVTFQFTVLKKGGEEICSGSFKVNMKRQLRPLVMRRGRRRQKLIPPCNVIKQ